MINPLSPDSGIYIESHPVNDINIFNSANMDLSSAITCEEVCSFESNEIVLLPDTDVAIKDQIEDSGFVIVDINDEQISDIAMQAILHSSPVVIAAGTHRRKSSKTLLNSLEKELSRQKFLFDVETTKKPEPFCGFRENKRAKFKRISK